MISSPSEVRQAKRDIAWAKNREQLIAGAAAGIHLALFSFNLAFWGFEGMPPDRYNPSNIRCGGLAVARSISGFVPIPLTSFLGSSLEFGPGGMGTWMGQSGFIMTISHDWRARIDCLPFLYLRCCLLMHIDSFLDELLFWLRTVNCSCCGTAF
jgi:hypothetical protein